MYRFQMMCKVTQIAIIIIGVVVRQLGNWEPGVFYLLLALIIGQSVLLTNSHVREA
ncbi:hypothetical protein LCGC14_1948780 [marine sediment metagenome]|uniref:Uncharacterized protein n=1 Tax=marine sediment metagenome TaxID=412755 RepID=A0A0F9IF39_9ZZZZ